jgi:DNA polymerase
VTLERHAVLRGIRAALESLRADGIDFVPRAARPLARGREAGAAPPTTSRPDPSIEDERARALREVREVLGDCRRCRLCEQRRTLVFGEGNPCADVVFIGEGPGSEEDRTGRPFVGKAGELLTRMIEATGWRREDVYICNVVKCRPPGNRDPQLDEIAACQPFLERQIRAIRPKVIITLGKPAISTLLGRPVAITKVRGLWQHRQGVPVMPTYHPAFLLRQYTLENRRAVWDDLRAARVRIEPESGSA